MQESSNDIDAMILEEKRISASECHGEAWAAGIMAGIESEIIAETAITTAIGELQREFGEDAVLELIDRIRERVIQGAFDPDIRRH